MATRVLPDPIRLGDCAPTKNKPRPKAEHRWPWITVNLPRALAFALLLGYALAAVPAVLTHWHFQDAGAYWGAAERLRSGGELYFSSPDLGLPTLYRYAPWFAYAWVPLTYLPHTLVMALWGALLAAAAAWLVWPNWRSPASVALSLLLLPDLLRVTSTGNVQGLMLAAVAFGLSSRWGPVIVGVAASLKGWPILFAAFFWDRRILVAVGVAALLVLPVLAFDLSGYPGRSGLLAPGTLSALLVVSRLLRPDVSRLGREHPHEVDDRRLVDGVGV